MRRINALYPTVFLLLVLIIPTGAIAEDLDQQTPYKITGYLFDYDAVTVSEGGLRLKDSHYRPLMITSAAADLFGPEPFSGRMLPQAGRTTSPRGFAVAAEYLATPDLAFHGAIGVTQGNWDADALYDTESSWEANIGVVYRLFNALSYQVHFGYMETGDIFKKAETYSEVESIIMVSNQLTLSF